MVSESQKWRVGKRSIEVSNLSKVFWPDDGYTKEDLLRYYMTVAPAMQPYLADRAGRPRDGAFMPPRTD